jgi:hypothetical protein
MIDPILSLAFSMQSNKGVYALLLGSGVSRSAGIPTGWEVTLDLIRKLAHMMGENCEPDPAKWYEEKYQEEANYSRLLKQITKTSAERTQLLRSYFEPTEEEREQNLKIPTKAHKAIANLVAHGYIRVILTTNFDRLMERALEEAGVFPTIISTTDSIQGAFPITHTNCTLIKLHGDYLDIRIKNTPEELTSYPKQLNVLLDRIFDEFGLIISGWSGEYDIALCAALFRCKSHRFATYWTIKDSLRDPAQGVSNLRRSELIQIQSADLFFSEILEKITAIAEYSQPHPLSAKLAVVSLKKYLETENEIRIHDLVLHEADTINKYTVVDASPTTNIYPTQAEFLRRLKTYESLTETLQAMMGCLGYWGKNDVEVLVVKVLELFTELQNERIVYPLWINLRLYPALLCLYSLGLAAIAKGNYPLLASLFLKPRNKYSSTGKYTQLILDLTASGVIGKDAGQWIPGLERNRTPTSDHLFELLRPSLRNLIPEEKQYEEVFDYFEYLQSLVICDIYSQIGKSRWVPLGRFGWKDRDYGNHISSIIQEELEAEKLSWKPLSAGLFGGSVERVSAAQTKLIEQLKQTQW